MRSRSLLAILFSAGLAVGVAAAEGKHKEDAAEATPAAVAGPATPVLPPGYNPVHSLAPLVDSLQPAVVNVMVEQKVEVPEMSHLFGPFFGMPQGQDPSGSGQERVQKGQGSGFIISADGYILTNNHVVDNADKVLVKLDDGRELQAKVVGTDSRTDVALVKIDTDGALPFVRLGDSEDMKVGDWVVAIGNPYGLSHTVTAGIVSAKGRVIGAGPYDDFIQTDASINPGNSGGPLFNLAGEVVGINTAIIGNASGIGFSVPVDMVKPILDDLKTDGRVARGWMGMGLQPMDADLAKALQVPDDTKGAVVAQLYPGFPAAEAGLQSQDVIVSFDGKPVESSEALVRAVGSHKPGEVVKVTVLRQGKEKDIKVTLGERPDEKALAKGDFQPESGKSGKDSNREGKGDGTALTRLGLSLEPAARFGGAAGDLGLVVTSVDSGGAVDGKLAVGDVVVQINGAAVGSVEDANRAIEKGGDVSLFVVQRDRSQRLVAVPRR